MSSFNGLERALGADLRSTVAAATCLAVLFHSCIRKVEIDHMVWHLLAISTLVFSALLYANVALWECGLLKATARTLLVAASFNTALAGSIAIYRLFLHPLRNFPGPLGAKISRFYNLFIVAPTCQYHLVVAKWVNKYGDIVRTGLKSLSPLLPTFP